MQLIAVRMLRAFRGHQIGEVVRLAPHVAEAWERIGVATRVDLPPEASGAPETAMLERGERAVMPPARPRGRRG